MLRVLVCMMLACVLSAQGETKQWMLTDDIRVTATGDSWTAELFSDTLEVVSCLNMAPEGNDPTFTSSWRDREGVTHTVTTPIIGVRNEDIDNAKARHLYMVTVFQQIFPPAPQNQ